MSKFWSIPVISAYLYGVTILTQYGYNSYFNIPSNLIESSVTQNFVYFFQLFQLGTAIAGAMKWWMWVVLILGALTVLFFYGSHFIWRKIISVIGLGLICFVLYGSYNFGSLLARSTSDFYVPMSDCASLDQNTRYIIPIFYQGKAILVPIDADRKMIGGILVKDLAELGCTTERKYVGMVTK